MMTAMEIASSVSDHSTFDLCLRPRLPARRMEQQQLRQHPTLKWFYAETSSHHLTHIHISTHISHLLLFRYSPTTKYMCGTHLFAPSRCGVTYTDFEWHEWTVVCHGNTIWCHYGPDYIVTQVSLWSGIHSEQQQIFPGREIISNFKCMI